MNILGVILNPLDWQIERGERAIDPMGVKFDAASHYPVKLDYEVECGYATVELTGNGGLYATVWVTSCYNDIKRKERNGGVKLALEVSNPPVGDLETVSESTLVCIAICDNLYDETQPAAEVIE